MSKHTPGPWHVVTGNKNRKFDEAVIRHAQPSGTHPITLARVTAPAHELGIANARLIAASPDLLEAVIQLLRHFPTDSDLEEAGWSFTDIEAAMKAHEDGRYVVAKATQ